MRISAPGRRARPSRPCARAGGSGFDAIWWLASVIPYASTQRHAVSAPRPAPSASRDSAERARAQRSAASARRRRADVSSRSRIIACSVGPGRDPRHAVVGSSSASRPRGVKRRGTTTVPPARERRERRRRRARARGRAASRSTRRRRGPGRRSAAIVARGGHEVAVQQRHLLRPARRAARVQEQRDVVGAAAARSGRRDGRPSAAAAHPQRAAPSSTTGDARLPPLAPRARRLAAGRRRAAARGRRGRRGTRARVGGVERRRAAPSAASGEQDRDDLGPVGQHDRHPVAALDAGRRELGGEAGCAAAWSCACETVAPSSGVTSAGRGLSASSS